MRFASVGNGQVGFSGCFAFESARATRVRGRQRIPFGRVPSRRRLRGVHVYIPLSTSHERCDADVCLADFGAHGAHTHSCASSIHARIFAYKTKVCIVYASLSVGRVGYQLLVSDHHHHHHHRRRCAIVIATHDRIAPV